MIRKAEILIFVFIVLNLCAVNLRAEVVTIHLTAEVTYLNDPSGLLDGKINVSDTITGSYIYDSSTPDTDVLNLDTIGHYQHSSSPFGVSLSVGGFTFQTDQDNVDFLFTIINNHYDKDTYYLASHNNLPLSNGVEIEYIGWQLDDYSSTALSSAALPTNPPVLEDWEYNRLVITFGYKGTSILDARVTNVIPEPATTLFLALGSFVLTRRRQ
jgi:hypothetical protein